MFWYSYFNSNVRRRPWRLHRLQVFIQLSSGRPGLDNIAHADACDIEPALLRWGARNGRSKPLGSAGAMTWALKPARLRWGARSRSSNPLGSAGPETLLWARPRMPASFNTETNILVHGMHGSALYIYIYMCICQETDAVYTYIYIYAHTHVLMAYPLPPSKRGLKLQIKTEPTNGNTQHQSTLQTNRKNHRTT